MDATLWWILGSGLAMSALSLVGGAALLLPEPTLQRLLLPLVALAAGSLLGGALFHMISAAVVVMGSPETPLLWVAAGFLAFLCLEQFLHWHHCHRTLHEHTRPLGTLILLADGLHNFVGGLAVGGTFVVDLRLGVTTWLVAAAHEVPQELGDFGALVHGGLAPRRALWLNFLSALTFVAGGAVAWAASSRLDVGFLVPFAAGNFLYIAAADLVPEINRHADWRVNVVHFVALAAGMGLLLAVRHAAGQP